jgi:crooked neck
MLQVKNRAPAPIQITAEQLLREAKERQLETAPKAPKQYIADNEELQLYRQGKRKDFEDQLRRQRHQIGIWCKYGLWEASQKEFERARSVFERALDIDYRNQVIWFKYAEMEMKNKFINHARNIWDRAISLHPRVDNFWYKYTYMEELAGAIEQARQLFERWMKWEPDDMAWSAYIKFEMRQGEIGRARGIFERYITFHPTCRAYMKYAKWEERQQEKANARTIYERALVETHETERRDGLMTSFARFEERCKEYERARAIYRFALGNTTREASPELFAEYSSFEKRHGDRTGIEEVVVAKKRSEYESILGGDNYQYDTWFDYIRLEEAEGDLNQIRQIYERSVVNVPPIAEKRYWRRYIYLWINYALFEELIAEDVVRTRAVYKACINTIPHKIFTFGKIWLLAAQFEVRQKDLTAARKLLGMAIGNF